MLLQFKIGLKIDTDLRTIYLSRDKKEKKIKRKLRQVEFQNGEAQ